VELVAGIGLVTCLAAIFGIAALAGAWRPPSSARRQRFHARAFVAFAERAAADGWRVEETSDPRVDEAAALAKARLCLPEGLELWAACSRAEGERIVHLYQYGAVEAGGPRVAAVLEREHVVDAYAVEVTRMGVSAKGRLPGIADEEVAALLRSLPGPARFVAGDQQLCVALDGLLGRDLATRVLAVLRELDRRISTRPTRW